MLIILLKKPHLYELPSKNKIEIFNEGCILMSCCVYYALLDNLNTTYE